MTSIAESPKSYSIVLQYQWAAEMPRSVLVTGCSEGGIGDAIAQEFHRKGYRVFATARKLGKIRHLKALGLDVAELDVTSSSSVDLAVEHICKETGGTLDVLVNNSGLGEQNSCIWMSNHRDQPY